ncbi:homeodomain-interacting protein kinase 2-like [Takifugu rubripes]|uniref:homeodomain-interacting protein kinase 2-like n=1 Tax=Takifugu rubripes TaxID=31033 RepID=UPI001145C9BD|nr:homeodomain-interacting protein kinase 2-like [Takifugu rubripes]XP_029683065.1 homeodomain-interacting protein kinase 2-like [Takifugu rubripes]
MRHEGRLIFHFQLFLALKALSAVGVIHTDIKPDNIMLKNWFDMRIKLIDFGVAIQDADVLVGDKVQPIGFRAPEILLGLPYTNAIDMWGVGCVLANLYLRFFLFNAHTDYEMMRQVVQLLGQPEDCLLHAGIYTKKYFTKVKGPHGSMWRLKEQLSFTTVSERPTECTESKRKKNTCQNFRDYIFPGLDELVYVNSFKTIVEFLDCHAFVDLLKLLLSVDGNRRISASQALYHPFITMSHLKEPSYEVYFNNAECFMKCCTETVLAKADPQQETTTTCQSEDTERRQKEMEIHSPEKRKSLQQHEERDQELKAGQDRTGTKHQPGSASSSLRKKISKRHCKFRNMFNACYICGWCPQY